MLPQEDMFVPFHSLLPGFFRTVLVFFLKLAIYIPISRCMAFYDACFYVTSISPDTGIMACLLAGILLWHTTNLRCRFKHALLSDKTTQGL